MHSRQERTKEMVFLTLIGVFIFSWAVIQPLNVSPDEHMRYRICQYIYENHTLPVGGDPAIRDQIWGYSYAFFPILSQIIGALFMTVASWFSRDAFVLLMAARMVSVLCGVGMAWFTMKIGEKLWKRPLHKWLFTIFVTLLPQCVFLFSYINNDSLALLATSMIIYSWLLGQETSWSIKSSILLAVGIILCALSYYNAYGVILASILLFAGHILLNRKDRAQRERLLKMGLLTAAIVIAGISWWFIRSYLLYDGDFLGLTISENYSQKYAIDSIKPSNRQTPCRLGQSLPDMLLSSNWFVMTVISFIGCFGYVSISLKNWMYLCYALIVAIGVAACVINTILRSSARKAHQEKRLFIGALLLTAIIPNLLSIAHSYCIDYQPQGRYSMSMLIPLMYFVTNGWVAIAGQTDFERPTSEKERKPAHVPFLSTWRQKSKSSILYGILTAWTILTVSIYFTIYLPKTL